MTRRPALGTLVTAVLTLAVAAPIVAAVLTIWLRGWAVQSVLTGSMAPSIRPGAAVVLEPVRAVEVRIGDVISFTEPGGIGTWSTGSSPSRVMAAKTWRSAPRATPTPCWIPRRSGHG